jgi:protein SCO1/2
VQTSKNILGELVRRPIFWAFLIMPIFSLALARGMLAQPPEMPAVVGALPEFQLTNQFNKSFGTADLKGTPFVVNFIFTSCKLACPKLTYEMEKIQHRTRNLGEGFKLISISVDPKTDTPEVLAAYAQEHHAHPSRWFFLTGSEAQILKIVNDGFKIGMGPDEVFGKFHGEKFVLVDGSGQVRGYYDSDPEGEEALIRDAGLLANFPGK